MFSLAAGTSRSASATVQNSSYASAGSAGGSKPSQPDMVRLLEREGRCRTLPRMCAEGQAQSSPRRPKLPTARDPHPFAGLPAEDDLVRPPPRDEVLAVDGLHRPPRRPDQLDVRFVR